MILSKAVLIAIMAICHGEQACMDSVKDLYPQSPGEVVHAYESLYGERRVCE